MVEKKKSKQTVGQGFVRPGPGNCPKWGGFVAQQDDHYGSNIPLVAKFLKQDHFYAPLPQSPCFVDNHSLRGVESGGNDTTEQESDQLAQDALIPPEIWDDGVILENPGPMAVLQMAWEAQVHPAIIAGRVRYETGNYRLLSQFVGTGEVRRQFDND